LCTNAPPRPQVKLHLRNAKTKIVWSAGKDKKETPPADKAEAMSQEPWLWMVQFRTNGRWSTEIFPMEKLSLEIDQKLDLVAVTAVNRFGYTSAPNCKQIGK